MPKNPKPTPKAVVRTFIAEVSELESSFDRLVSALGASSALPSRSLENVVAEQFATSVAIIWGNFIHDVLVTYVLRNHRKYFKGLQKRVLSSVSDRFGLHCSKKLVFAFGTPAAISDIEPLLDPKGWNITARSGDDLATTANNLLKGSIARKFSLDSHDRLFVDLVIALRNYLAHRSAGSRAALIEIIRGIDQSGKNAGLEASPIRLNKYLSEPSSSGTKRLKLIFSRVKQIAKELD